jgi:hypothetical protein
MVMRRISPLLSLYQYRAVSHPHLSTAIFNTRYSTMAKVDQKQAALDFLSFVNASPTRKFHQPASPYGQLSDFSQPSMP